ncbi:unnamed protein product [Cylindrotheca closterium]|uniref:Uncharacterized protein n=1 Tax=Cylindrotheca closterium TaxID=2856 RepID=A0AAD2FVF7_9STRA|nr:unnamed protein product [Cylindrotheca closterium]
MPFVSRASDNLESAAAGVEVEIKVKIKFNLKHGFSAGDTEDTTPEQKELDNALAKVWDNQGENIMYEQNLMDDEEEEDDWEVDERSTYDDESAHYDSDEEEREEASHDDDDDDDMTVKTGEFILNDNEDSPGYAVLSTHKETEVKLEEINSADMEHADAYLDSVLRPPSRSGEDDDKDAGNDGDDIPAENMEATKKARSRKESSSEIVRYDNQDYFLAVLSHIGKEYATNEDVDRSIAIVEDNPYEEPTTEEELAPKEEAPEDGKKTIQNEDQFLLGCEMSLTELGQILLLNNRFPTQHHQNNHDDTMLGASDAMARQIKRLINPLLELGSDSKRFYMDDDVESTSSEDLSGLSFEDENDEDVVIPRSISEDHAIDHRCSSSNSTARKSRSGENEHVPSLQKALSVDNAIPERIIGPGERNIANFLKTHFGVDLYDTRIDEREYKDFVSTHFLDSRLLNYQRMRWHAPRTSSRGEKQRIRSQSTDGQGRRRKPQQQKKSRAVSSSSTDSTKKRTASCQKHRHPKMEV